MPKQELSDYQHDAFISYCHSDGTEMAEFLEAALGDRAGLAVWRDKFDLPYGPELLKKIVLGLERSRTVIAVISAEYAMRPWCMGEFFIGAAYNNFIPVLAPDVQFEQIPYGLKTASAVKFADLESNAELLNKFCMDVFRCRDERKHRTGFAGLPLPADAGESVQVLLQLRKWPFDLVQADRNRIRLSEAVIVIRNSSVPGIIDAFAVFSKPSTVTQGLSQMREVLDSATNCTDEWRALGRLARPFNEAWSSYAFSNAKLSDEQLANEEGFSRNELVARQKRPRLRRGKFNARQIAVLSKVERLIAVGSPVPAMTATTDRIRSVEPDRHISSMTDTKQAEQPIAAPMQMPTSVRVLEEAPHSRRARTTRLPLILRSLGAVSLWIAAAAASHFGQQYNGAAMVADDANAGTIPVELIAEEAEGTLEQGTEAPTEATVSRLPSYCTTDGLCTFPPAYTLWRVAEECFGDGKRFGEVWDRNKATLDADPNKVRAGQSFLLKPGDCL